jgi:hypothetical protein
MDTWATHILRFYHGLKVPFALPRGIEALYAFHQPEVRATMEAFYNKYYNDVNARHVLIGINPGRFGGGVTGIPFTDPINLARACGIANPWPRKAELSSVFMYAMMEAYGSVEQFYRHFYITSVSPVGFVQHGKNLNYYDNKLLEKRITPFAVKCMEQQLAFGIRRDVGFCIGGGENLRFLTALNQKHGWFDRIEPLPHPRWIMQYRRRQIAEYITQYQQALLSSSP